MFKVTFNFSRPCWHSFGRVVFVELEEDATAAAQALAGDGVLDGLEVRAATAGEFERHQQFVEKAERWKANVAAGIPNRRGDI